MDKKALSYIVLLMIAMLLAPTYAFAGNNETGAVGYLIITLIVIVVIFLVCREIVCWYWKINETLEVLREIRDLLKRNSMTSQTKRKSNQKQFATAIEETATEKEIEDCYEDEAHTLKHWECACGQIIPTGNKCPDCGTAI